MNSLIAEEYIIAPPQSEFDSSYIYYRDLLQLILDKTHEKYGNQEIYVSKHIITQGRAISELVHNTHSITLHRMGTTSQRESILLPIRIPLVKGILGYRIFIIHKSMENTFAKIKNLDDLKKYRACQGSQWPDTKILKNAGLKVLESANYEAMFKLLQRGRCDYFPRAIHEGPVEVLARKDAYPELMIEPTLMLQYTFPMYFFTHKTNRKMARRLEEGLMIAINDSSFDRLIEQHPTTSHVYPLSKWSKRTTIILPNHLLPKATPLSNKKLWLNINAKEQKQQQLSIQCSTPRPEVCTMDYKPVCASKDNGLRCITTPCPSTEQVTYSNACNACADPLVISYVANACQ